MSIRNAAAVFLLVSVFMLRMDANATQLSGTYTIDVAQTASATNFKNISSAVTYLSGNGVRSDAGPANAAPFGVSGPVIFNIATATYNERLVINTITGTSAINTITFRAASGNAADVILTNNLGTSSGGYLVNMTRADYVSFKNITFTPTSTTYYAIGALTTTYCLGDSIVNCVLNNNVTYTGSITVNITRSKNVSLRGNVFNASINHFAATFDTSLAVTSNTFNSLNNNGISINLNECEGYRIDDNVLAGLTAQGFTTGILNTSSSTPAIACQIINNKISNYTNYGIQIYNAAYSAANRLLIANNFIQIPAGNGIDLYGYYPGSNVNIFHNTINHTGTTGFCINSYYFMNTFIKNNILINGASSTSVALYKESPTSSSYSLTLDYNDYYSSDTTKYAVVRAKDTHPLFENIAFVSPADLHHSQACLKGIALAEVTKDIDGETRSASTPTRGADEVVPFSFDAGVTRIISPNPNGSIVTGTATTVSVKVRNYGTTTITTLEGFYNINGTIQSQTFTGLSIAGCDSATLTFSTSYTFTQEANTMSAYTGLVNGNTDGNPANNALAAKIFSGMSGTYTINATGSGTSNFKSFGEADSALISRGVIGAVLFNIYPGTYDGDTLRMVAGVSAVNNIIFKSFNNDTASVIFNRQIIVTEGAGFYTFRSLKFTGLPSDWDRGGSGQISILRNAHDILVENCSFNTPSFQVCNSYICSYERTYAVRSLNAASNIVVRNNKMSGTILIESAIENPGNPPLTKPAVATTGVVISGNRIGSGRGFIFTSYTVNGINVTDAPSAIVDSNFVQNDLIYVKSSGAFRVTRNRLWDQSNLSFQTYVGFIGNLYAYTNTNAISAIGSGTAAGRAIVANNMIHIKPTGGNGLYVSGDYIDIVYNSINDRSDMAVSGGTIYNTTGPSTAAVIAGSNTIFKNNIVSGIHTAGTSYKGQIISSTLPAANVDYNGYYSTEPTKNFATQAAGNASTFATWQVAGNDAHGVFVNPKFFTDTLLRPNQNALNGKGTPIASTTFDFEGQERHATNPDIGADEFELPSADAGVIAYVSPNAPFASGSTPVQVKIKNYGTAPLTSAVVNWTVNNVTQTPFTFSGNVAYDSTSNAVTIGNYNFPAGIAHNLVFWTSLPNGITDTLRANDTLRRSNLYAALNGAYTIGGTTPDFTTFNLAVNAMKFGGVTGPVAFNVRNGTYTEQVRIPEITGASATNRITFQGESGDSSLVKLNYFNSDYQVENPTLVLDSADNLIFRKISILNTSTYNGNMVVIKNGASFNEFYNCYLRTNAGWLVTDSATSIDSNLVFKNNRFGKCTSGALNMSGISSTVYEGGLIIEDNFFDSTGSTAINATYLKSPGIRRNYFQSNSGGNAILLSSSTGAVEVSGNQVTGTWTTAGIQIFQITATAAQPVRVFNNMVSISGTYAFTVSSVTYCDVYYNTFRNRSTSPSSVAFYVTNGDYINSKNNIIHNNVGYAYLFGNSVPANFTSNYNDLYTTGAITVLVGTPAGSYTFAQWKTAYAGKEVNSKNAEPVYISNTDLHINRSFSAINNAGTPIAGIITDIDDDMRNATTPDIGADEFAPYQFEAGLQRFNAPVSPFTAGSQPVKVTLRNFALPALTTATIQWTVNGTAQPDYAWTGTLNSNDSIIGVTIGNFNFGVSGQDYVVKAWVTNPNGGTDENNANDTLLKAFTPALCGAYTVGGTSPNYNTLQDAANALTKGGVVCPVVLNIRNGVYVGQTTFKPIAGTTAVNNVTIQSESGDSSLVKLIGECDGSGFNFNPIVTISVKGADYLTFSKITIQKRNTGLYCFGAGQLITVDSLAINELKIKNSYLKSVAVTDNAIVNTTAVQQQTISNCLLDSTQINISGTKAFILNNHLTKAGITTAMTDTAFITGNTIDTLGISCSSTGKPVVSLNTITAPGTAFAININGGNGGSITRNKVSNARSNGIYTSSMNGTAANPFMIANNFVHTTGAAAAHGIYVANSSYVNVYYNSVNITSTLAASSALYLSSAGNSNVVNNNLVNSGTGYAYYVSGTLPTTSNYNNLFKTGTNLGYYNADRTDLAAWRTATVKDANSKSVTPQYASATNLHTTQPQLDSAGIVTPLVTIDIDGEARNTVKPDIGADEFTAATGIDGGVLRIVSPANGNAADPNKAIQVRLANYGGVTITSATVNYKINNSATQTFNYTGSVAGLDSTAPVTIGTFNFGIDTSYNIVAWTSNINGNGADLYSQNDTAAAKVYAGLCGTYTIGGTAPGFTTIAKAIQSVTNGGTICPVIFNIRSGTYTDTLNFVKVPNSSAVNTVTFQSEANDSAAVIINSLNNSTTGSHVKFSNAANIIVRKLTFNNANTFGTNSFVQFLNNNKNIQFTDNVLKSVTNLTNTPSGISSVSAGSLDTSITIRNNIIRNVSNGILLRSDADNSSVFSAQVNMPGILVEGNDLSTLSNQFGIQLKNCIAPVVKGNVVKGNVEIKYSSAAQVSANKINIGIDYNPGYANDQGIVLNNVTGTTASHSLIVNNFVFAMDSVASNANAPNGIALGQNTNYVDVWYNNVNLVHTDSLGSCLLVQGNNISVKNNSFYSTKARVYEIYGTLSELDYNNAYTTGNSFGINGSSVYADFAVWKAGTGKEANSKNVNPAYVTRTDLHVQAIELNNAATAIASITTDIDGQARSTTTPDIGADEFSPLAVDAELKMVSAPVKQFLNGTQPVKVILKNNGTAPLTSTTINWSVNGEVQTPFSFSGNLASQATQEVIVGTYVYKLNVANPTAAYVTNTNGAGEINNANDTAKNTDLWAGLSGTYTLGGATPNFISFAQLTQQLSNGGVVGAVTINVRNGNYNEQAYFNGMPGSSAAKRVTIQSESGDSSAVRLYSSNNSPYNYTLVLYNCPYLTMRKMTVENTGSSGGLYSKVIEAGLNSPGLIFENLLVKGVIPATVADALNGNNDLLQINYYAQQIKNNDSTIIRNCNFINGGKAISSNGSNYANAETKNVLIENNTLTNQLTGGIFTTTHSKPIIRNNIIRSTTTNPAYKGISLYATADSMYVINNQVAVNGDGVGLEVTNVPAYNGTDGVFRIVNNFIQIGENAATKGVSLQGGGIHFIHNSVRNTSSNATSTAVEFLSNGYVPTTNAFTGNGIKLLNNILSSTGTGYAIRALSTNTTFFSNYNDLFTNGTKLGNYNSTDYSNLTTWIAGTGRDNNSVSANPNFFAKADLHSRGQALNGSALILVGIEKDIDNEPRSTSTPDIGADEFSQANAGITDMTSPTSGCSNSAAEPVKVVVKNFGNSLQNYIPVAYRINGGALVRDTVRTAINAGDSAIFTFATPANLNAIGQYRFDAFTEIQGDSIVANDTLRDYYAYTSVQVTSYPYYQTFENDNGNWFSLGKNNSWKWGVPSKPQIDSAASGTKAWVTNLTGPYNNNEKSYLYSPCFDLNSFTVNPKLWFQHAYQVELGNDSSWVEYSEDGITWMKLGTSGSGEGWYNNATRNVWDGIHKEWHLAGYTIPLQLIGNKSNVRFRIAFQSNGSDVRDGVGIDDIFIDVNIPVSNTTFTGKKTNSEGMGAVDVMNGASRVLQINDNGNNLGTVTVDCQANVPPINNNGEFLLGRSWVIKVQNQPTSPVTLRLYFTNAEFAALQAVDPSITTVNTMSGKKYSGANEDFDLTNNTAGSDTYISSSNITYTAYPGGYYAQFTVGSFSEFWLGKINQVLPLTLQSFNARWDGSDGDLSWATQSEQNLQRFIVERSIDGFTYASVGTVTASGNSTVLQQYQFRDANAKNVSAANVYYRLKMVNSDGTFTYSNVAMLSIDGNSIKIVNIAPNPFKDRFTLNISSGKKAAATILVLDANGKLVMRENTVLERGSNSVIVNGGTLTKGMYLVRLIADDAITVFKIVKQ